MTEILVDLSSEMLDYTLPNSQNLPIFEGEDGELYCLGHIPVRKFLQAVLEIVAEYNGDDPNKPEYQDMLNDTGDVQHLYAQGYQPHPQYPDFRFRFTGPDVPLAVPMTKWEA